MTRLAAYFSGLMVQCGLDQIHNADSWQIKAIIVVMVLVGLSILHCRLIFNWIVGK